MVTEPRYGLEWSQKTKLVIQNSTPKAKTRDTHMRESERKENLGVVLNRNLKNVKEAIHLRNVESLASQRSQHQSRRRTEMEC